MQTEAENFSKSGMDSQLAAIENIESSELPTKLVDGIERPVHMENYKRRMKRQLINAHNQAVLDGMIAVAVDAGHLKATGFAQQGKLIIYLNGLDEEDA